MIHVPDLEPDLYLNTATRTADHAMAVDVTEGFARL
jgi:hypothetical protein